MTGIERIAAERRRQIEKEGWTPEHDDEHGEGELALVAACYAMTKEARGKRASDPLARLWPDSWDWEWWKPARRNRIRELEKAGALIAAEIDRLQRLEAQPE
jgi:hypothetical protein